MLEQGAAPRKQEQEVEGEISTAARDVSSTPHRMAPTSHPPLAGTPADFCTSLSARHVELTTDKGVDSISDGNSNSEEEWLASRQSPPQLGSKAVTSLDLVKVVAQDLDGEVTAFKRWLPSSLEILAAWVEISNPRAGN